MKLKYLNESLFTQSSEMHELADKIIERAFEIYTRDDRPEADEISITLSQEFRKRNRPLTYFLDEFSIDGLTIKCFVSKNFSQKLDLANFDIKNKIISIMIPDRIFSRPYQSTNFWSDFESRVRDFLSEVIYHEMFHSIDRKIQDPNLRSKWSDRKYVLQPAEEDAFIVELIPEMSKIVKSSTSDIKSTWEEISNSPIISRWRNQIRDLDDIDRKRNIKKLWKTYSDIWQQLK